MNGRTQQFAQSIGRWLEAHLWIGLALGASKVAHQDQLSTAIDHGFDRRQRHFDATVVCDFQVVVQRDVKVDSHENGFGCDVDIVNVFL